MFLTIPPTALPGFVTKIAENGPAVLIAGAAAWLLFKQYSASVTKMFDFLSVEVLKALQDIREEIAEIKRNKGS